MRWNNFFSSIYGNLGIKLSLALAVLFALLLLFILLKLSSKKKKKQMQRGEMKNYLKKIKIDKKKRTPKEELLILDQKAKAFFQSKTHANEELSYTKVIERLKKQKQDHPSIIFCENMNYFLYSGKKSTKNDVKNLEMHFEKIKNKFGKMKLIETKEEIKSKKDKKILKKTEKKPKEKQEQKKTIKRKLKKIIEKIKPKTKKEEKKNQKNH